MLANDFISVDQTLILTLPKYSNPFVVFIFCESNLYFALLYFNFSSVSKLSNSSRMPILIPPSIIQTRNFQFFLSLQIFAAV